MNPHQLKAILWAQWRSLLNRRSHRLGHRFPLAIIFAVLWYSVWLFGAYLVALFAADPQNVSLLQKSLGAALLGVFVYWQIVPVAMVSSGLSLDLNRLVVYPIPQQYLFGTEEACGHQQHLHRGRCTQHHFRAE